MTTSTNPDTPTPTLRGTAITTRVGLALGVAVMICFVTGFISHFVQHPQPWFYWPTRPVWLYRATQGLHIISGIAAIPLLVVKLWSVYPKLFEKPIIGGLTKQLERASILVLMASMLFHCGCQPRRVLIFVGSATSAGAADHSWRRKAQMFFTRPSPLPW